MLAASSDARKTNSAAISSGWAWRRRGIFWFTCSSISSVYSARCMGVSTYPGATAQTRTLGASSRAMDFELAPKVRVCAVAPGYVLTPMQRAEYTDEMLEQVNQKIPLRRHAQPEEVAGLFAFLASDDAAYLTGHVYTIDGAETAGGLASR